MYSLVSNVFAYSLMSRLQDYSTDALKSYFEQDGLLMPIETIRGKYRRSTYFMTLNHSHITGFD